MFHDKPLILSKWAELGEKKFPDLIKEMKMKICLMCTKNIDINSIIQSGGFQSPCGCMLCSKQCSINYLHLIFNRKLRTGKYFFYILFCIEMLCLCSYQFNNNDFKTFYEYSNENKLKDLKKIIELIIKQNLVSTCIFCLEDSSLSDKEFHLLRLKDKKLTDIYKIKEFKHVICLECYSKKKILE